jgi:hypothetical protein
MMRIVVVAVIWIGLGRAHADRLKAPDGTIKDVPEQSVEFALKDGYTRLPTIMMRGTDGDVYYVPVEEVGQMEARGWWTMTKSEQEDFFDKKAEAAVQAGRSMAEAEESRKTRIAIIIAAVLLALPIGAALMTRWARRRIGRGIADG